jgi:hypothetical protein
MSLEPKPRSMAAVTITVLRWNSCLSKIRLFAGISEYLQVLAQYFWAVTIRGVRTISRKDQLAGLVELESSETTRRTAEGAIS